jgi:hypothetical protein
MELFSALIPIIETLFGVISPIIDILLDWLVPAFQMVASVVQSVIVPIVEVLAGVFRGISSALSSLFAFWQKIWETIKEVFSAVWEKILGFFTAVITRIMVPVNAIKNAVSGAFKWLSDKIETIFSSIGNFVKGIFDGLLGIIKAPINALISAINFVISKVNTISYTVPDWVPFVGGKHFGFNIPLIPELALGGTVLPQPGGTLVRLAEKGRAETVVDTGLMNRMLDNLTHDMAPTASNSDRVEYLLEQLLAKDASVYLYEQRMAVGMVGSNQTTLGALDQISARGGASWAR